MPSNNGQGQQPLEQVFKDYLESAKENGWDVDGADRDFLTEAFQAGAEPNAGQNLIKAVVEIQETPLPDQQRDQVKHDLIVNVKEQLVVPDKNSARWQVIDNAEQRYREGFGGKKYLDTFLQNCNKNGWDIDEDEANVERRFLIEAYRAANLAGANESIMDAVRELETKKVAEDALQLEKYGFVKRVKDAVGSFAKDLDHNSKLWRTLEEAEMTFVPRGPVEQPENWRELPPAQVYGTKEYEPTFLENARKNGWDVEGADKEFLSTVYKLGAGPESASYVAMPIKLIETEPLDPAHKAATKARLAGHIQRTFKRVEAIDRDSMAPIDTALLQYQEEAVREREAEQPNVQQQPNLQQPVVPPPPQNVPQPPPNLQQPVNRRNADLFHRDDVQFGSPDYLDTFIAKASRNGWDVRENSPDHKLLVALYKAAADPQHADSKLAEQAKLIENVQLGQNFPNVAKHNYAVTLMAGMGEKPLEDPLMQAVREVVFAYSIDAFRMQQVLAAQAREERRLREEEEALEHEDRRRRRQQDQQMQEDDYQLGHRNGFKPASERRFKNKRFREADEVQALTEREVEKRNTALQGSLKTEADDLASTRRFAGGSSSEHREMLESIGNLMLVSGAKNYSAMAKADALMEARKKTDAYIMAKRGKHLSPNWKPRSEMGQNRFEAANATLDRINEEIGGLGLNGIYSKIYDLQEDLGAKHWHGFGGSTPEHRNMLKKVKELKRACLAEEPGYSPEKKAEALRVAKKAALAYIQKKRGDHPEGWLPRSSMGSRRFEAAELLVQEIDKEMAALGITDEPEAARENTKQREPGKGLEGMWRGNSMQRQQPRPQPMQNAQDPASIAPYQAGIKDLTERMQGMSYRELKENFAQHRTEMFNMLVPLIAKKAVYNQHARKDPNYATDPNLRRLEQEFLKGIVRGGSEKVNTLAFNIKTPEQLIELGKLASMGNGNYFMKWLNGIKTAPIRRQQDPNTMQRNRDLGMQ